MDSVSGTLLIQDGKFSQVCLYQRYCNSSNEGIVLRLEGKQY